MEWEEMENDADEVLLEGEELSEGVKKFQSIDVDKSGLLDSQEVIVTFCSLTPTLTRMLTLMRCWSSRSGYGGALTTASRAKSRSHGSIA